VASLELLVIGQSSALAFRQVQRAIHTFDNGVRVYDDHLLEEQRQRYQKRNVHEAEEEDIFVDLIRRLPPEGCFVDVGAAIGYYLILARKLSSRLTIHAVEPLERHRAFLHENATLNGLRSDDFIVHREGLTSSEGTETFLDRGYGSRIPLSEKEKRISLSTRWKRLLERIGLRTPKKKGGQILTIPTITLDTLLRRIGRQIDLLQMDVQGLEVEVLKGGAEAMAAGEVKIFLIGTHGRASGLTTHQGCLDLLRTSGYTIEIDQPDTKEQPDGIIVARR
jgi:FkbM family methyltransferase